MPARDHVKQPTPRSTAVRDHTLRTLWARFTGLSVERIPDALGVLATRPRGEDLALRMVSDYSLNNVSAKVLRIIISYTGFVDRRVWRKPDF